MTPTTHQRFVCHDPSADPVDDLRTCEAAIRAAGWWDRSELKEVWPLMTDQVASLLSQSGEFDIDEAGLLDLIDRRLLARPATGESDKLEWSAADVILASGLLEMRQQWRATPSGHDAKKHPCQLLLEQARAAGEVEEITRGDPDKLTPDQLRCAEANFKGEEHIAPTADNTLQGEAARIESLQAIEAQADIARVNPQHEEIVAQLKERGIQSGWTKNKVELEILRASRPQAHAPYAPRASGSTPQHLSASLMVKAGYSAAAAKNVRRACAGAVSALAQPIAGGLVPHRSDA